MNTEPITICNLITPAELVSSTPAKPGTDSKTFKDSTIGEDHSIQTNSSETKKTDNSFRHVHDKAVNKHSQNDEEKPQTSDSTQSTNKSTKTDIQTKSPGANAQETSVQNYFTEGPEIVTTPKIPKTVDNINIKQQASNSSPHSTVTLKGRKVPSAYLQNSESPAAGTEKQVKINPSQTQEKPIRTTGQIKSDNQEKVSETANNIINKSEQKTTDINSKTDVLNNQAVDSKSPVQTTEKKNSPEPVIPTDSKTDVNTDKQNINGSPDNKNNKEVSPPTSNKPITEIPINNKVNTTVENKTDLQSDLKTEPDKSSDTQTKSVNTLDNKPAQTIEKTLETKTAISGNTLETSRNNNNNNRKDSGESETNSNNTKINFEDIRVTSEQAQKSNGSVTNKSMDSDATQPHNQNTEPVAEPIQNTTRSTEQPTRATQNDNQPDVGKQIYESIRSSGNNQIGQQQITVRLNPPELGKVYIRFQEQDNQITGILEVSKSQTRVEIEQAIPQIVRNLSDSGIQVKRLEVVLNNEQSGNENLNKEQLFQNGDSQNQKHDNSDSWQSGPNRSEINEFFVNNSVYQNNSKLQQVSANGSINMLI